MLAAPTGFHRLHPDTSLNFQLNRWLQWLGPQALPELRAIAAGIRGYDDWRRAFVAASDRAAREGRALPAAVYARSAEFFLAPGDPGRAALRARFLDGVRSAYGIEPGDRDAVPVAGGRLPAYRFAPGRWGGPGPARGTVVVFGGFDSYLEEFLPLLAAFARAGHEVVGFEGPGQGGALEDHGLVMTPDWHAPVAAVLDHFAVTEATIVGISLGGALVMRAAAFEPRAHRVIADGAMTDFLACNLGQLPRGQAAITRGLLSARAGATVDRLARWRMRRSPVAGWGIRQGMHVLGAAGPYDYLRRCARYETRSVSGRIEADVLLLAGTEDHYVPLGQLHEQARLLTRARSVTTRAFTRAEQAQAHCQIGNVGRSVDVMLAWLDATGGG